MDKIKATISGCVEGCPPSMARYKDDPAVLLQHVWLFSVVSRGGAWRCVGGCVWV